VGAIVAAGLNGSEFEGIILGVGGALIGTFGGFPGPARNWCSGFGLQGLARCLGRGCQARSYARCLAMGIVTG